MNLRTGTLLVDVLLWYGCSLRSSPRISFPWIDRLLMLSLSTWSRNQGYRRPAVSVFGMNCQKIMAKPPIRSSQSQGGVGDPPEPLVLRAPGGGRRGVSCCGGRFSMRSHSIPETAWDGLDENRVTAARPIVDRRPPHLNCSEDSPKVQGVPG